MKYLVFTLLVFIFSACKPIADKPVDAYNPKFNTTEDSELFFKNVRQIAYDLERQKNTKIDIYRSKKQDENNKIPKIHLAIAHNWRYDEAYILIELGAYFKSLQNVEIHWKNEKSGETGIYEFQRKSNKNEYFRFASEIYNSIVAQHTLWVMEKENKIFFLENPEEREAFKTTMKDYYRLVALF